MRWPLVNLSRFQVIGAGTFGPLVATGAPGGQGLLKPVRDVTSDSSKEVDC